MSKVLILVEGQTEETFAREVLAPHLSASGVYPIAKLAATKRVKSGPQTAPSKRLKTLFPEYQKPLHGPLVILEIGLEQIRRECPHFDSWLARLEKLASER